MDLSDVILAATALLVAGALSYRIGKANGGA